MKGRELPVALQREYTTYLWGAFPLCVALAAPELRPWYLEHFVELYSERDGAAPHLDFVDAFGYHDVLCVSTLDRQACESAGSIVDLVRQCVEAETYCVVFVDEGHLRSRGMGFPHELLVYGYDDEAGEVLAVGFGDGGLRNLSRLRFAYREFADAFVRGLDTGPGIHTPVQTLRPRDRRPAFDLARFTQRLVAYRSGRSTVEWMDVKRKADWWRHPEDRSQPELRLGLGVYDHVIAHLERVAERAEVVDYRIFHLLHEHKRGLLVRLEFVATQGVPARDLNPVVAGYRTVSDAVDRLRRRLLFNRHAQDRAVLSDGVAALAEVREREAELLDSLTGRVCP